MKSLHVVPLAWQSMACCGNHTFSWQFVAFCILGNFQVKLDGPCYVKVIRLLHIVSLQFVYIILHPFWVNTIFYTIL